jgi:peptidoglycan/LPS O-acetylase OafA/YrhL
MGPGRRYQRINPIKSMEYRREIDGLRALAVLSVILFHAGFESFSGGFVGVDVFFVISGYLITKIILSDLERGTFSLVDFYERRARRILPALFFVMIVCLPFAWAWLLPNDMRDFSQSLVAVAVFGSNVLFWRESGYFSTAAELKPLLHTWSLAVEEQYYVLFPLVLMALWGLGKRRLVIVLGSLFVVSLAIAQWASYFMPEAAFYLLPSRGWELLMGGLVAFYLGRTGREECVKGLCEFGGWLGVFLILFSVFFYDKTTPFPSFYALVPTLGTALIILFATQQTTVGKLIGNRVFVGIGLISYSAYLWHQPLFAFARHISHSKPNDIVFGLLSVAAIGLAYLSWRFVESPFRSRAVIGRWKVFALALSFSLFFVIVGYSGHAKNGFEGRFSRLLHGDIGHVEFFKYMDANFVDCEPKSMAEQALSWDGFIRCKQSMKGLPEVVLVGDSHAEHLFLGLAESIPGKNVAFYIQAGIPYIGNSEFDTIFSEVLRNTNIRHVFLTMHYFGRVDAQGNGLYDGFSTTIKALRGAGKSVTLVGDVPVFEYDPSACVYSRKKMETSCAIGVEDARRQRERYDALLSKLAVDHGLRYVRLDESLCGDAECVMFKGDSILYRDNNHLNIAGSKMVGRYLAEKSFGAAVN